MSDTEPKSTTTSPDLENNNGQPSHVAVSEENLAALLRATINTAEPAAPRLAESANAAPAIDANESSAAASQTDARSPAAVASPPSHVVESRLALFAAVKENRSAISRSGLAQQTPIINQPPAGKAIPTTGPAKPPENISASLPTKVLRRQTIVPDTVSLTPAPVAAIASSSPNTINDKQTENTTRARLVIGLVSCAALAAVGVSIFLLRTHPTKPPSVVAAAPKENVPLQVRVEPLGKGLIDVRWNPQNASVAQARDGRLVITESDQKPRILPLDREQLKTGHLTYQSVAENVEFDLEIVDGSGAIVKESVLALQSPISSPPATATPPQTSREQPVAAKLQNIPSPVAAVAVPQPSQPSVRTFIPPPTQQKIEQRTIVDAPPTLANGSVMPAEVNLSAPLAAIPPPAKNGTVQQQIQVESNVQAANLIKKVIPTYPQLARSTRIQGTVRFTAHIGKDGRILNLKFTSGPSVLVDAAAAAVKQWVYRPTLLNGVPVEVITQIDVNFTLNQNAH
jgi:TonB family protein